MSRFDTAAGAARFRAVHGRGRTPLDDVCRCPYPNRCAVEKTCVALRAGPDGRLVEQLPAPTPPGLAEAGRRRKPDSARFGRRAQRQAAVDWIAGTVTDIVARVHNKSARDLRSHRRPGHLMEARFSVSRLIMALTNSSYPEVARAMNRDHTTIMYQVRELDRLLAGDAQARARYDRALGMARNSLARALDGRPDTLPRIGAPPLAKPEELALVVDLPAAGDFGADFGAADIGTDTAPADGAPAARPIMPETPR